MAGKVGTPTAPPATSTSPSPSAHRLSWPVGDLGPGLSSHRPPPGDLGRWGRKNAYPDQVKRQFLGGDFDGTDPERTYEPPKPEQAKDAVRRMATTFHDRAKAAYDR